LNLAADNLLSTKLVVIVSAEFVKPLVSGWLYEIGWDVCLHSG